jgi:hypothetical protein
MSFMLNVTYKPFMMSIIMLNVTILKVVMLSITALVLVFVYL